MNTATQMHVRLGVSDTHYPGGLIPASTLLRLMSDCGTVLMLKEDGRSGLLAKWNEANFHAPVRVGEFILVECEITRKGNRSRDIACRVMRTVELRSDGGGELTDRRYVREPELVADGSFVGVVPPADAESTS